MKTILVDAFNTLIIKDMGLNQAMVALLDAYPNPKLVLTNATPEEQKTMGIDQSPYDLFSLSHAPNKTDPHFFVTMLAQHRLHVDEVVYFEHNKQAVQSAQSLGMVTYHYDHMQSDLAALKAFLDGHLT